MDDDAIDFPLEALVRLESALSMEKHRGNEEGVTRDLLFSIAHSLIVVRQLLEDMDGLLVNIREAIERGE